MRIGLMTGILLALLLPDGSDRALISVTLAIGFFGGEALSSKLDALARANLDTVHSAERIAA